MDAPTIFDPAIHSYLVPSLSALHADCIVSPPYMIGNFLPPLNDSAMLAWWTALAAEVTIGTTAIVMQLAKDAEGKEVVAGVVLLGMPVSQTSPFTGLVHKLLVAPAWRNKGIAKKLMVVLEGIAREKKRGLLLIHAEKDAPGSKIYPRWGYTVQGILPKSQISPGDGQLKDVVYMYKDMREAWEEVKMP
ncbi:hypothetical protein VTL71DRAFT_14524 [Oculimacula yallundae]|uniref:N-acetyltransferase domain-containing protein n=1 Tax=Oculimacula yallundae TaxID=86028 RepID=A0ABR4CIQ7_9HELO